MHKNHRKCRKSLASPYQRKEIWLLLQVDDQADIVPLHEYDKIYDGSIHFFGDDSEQNI